MDIDITTGHLILGYLEEHLKNRDRLEAEWGELCKYEADDASLCEAASRPSNAEKNRANFPVPYEQSRVKLRSTGREDDYINASLVYDDEPRNPAYVVAQSPMDATAGDFWQMVWDQAVVVLINLDRPDELHRPSAAKTDVNGHAKDAPVQYWPAEGSRRFGQFEVHLVSEHHCCPEFLVRSFYLKSLLYKETRTITQFHFVAWESQKPLLSAVKPMLDFRRKVNRSFRAKSSPVLVHCVDGCGLTGMYLLLDLALNRIVRGLKELDIAASLEHLRDQRQGMVTTKDQYEFVLTAIAEEVNSLLNSTI